MRKMSIVCQKGLTVTFPFRKRFAGECVDATTHGTNIARVERYKNYHLGFQLFITNAISVNAECNGVKPNVGFRL